MVQISTDGEAERAMQVSVTEAEGQPTELVRRAEAGEEIILTRRAILDAVRLSAAGRPSAGPDAARSQDFLYGKDFPRTDLDRA